MPTLAQARDLLAQALSDASGGTVHPRPPVHAADQGDGWVLVRKVDEGRTFGPGLTVTLEAVVLAGTDETTAEAYVDSHAAALHAAATDVPDLLVAAVSVEPQALIVGASQAPLYVLTITVTTTTEG